MSRLFSLTILIALFLGLNNSASSAVKICDSRDKIINQLTEKYREQPRGRGITIKGAVLELLSSTKGTWTIILTAPNGNACIMAAGKRWQVLEHIEEEHKIHMPVQ